MTSVCVWGGLLPLRFINDPKKIVLKCFSLIVSDILSCFHDAYDVTDFLKQNVDNFTKHGFLKKVHS